MDFSVFKTIAIVLRRELIKHKVPVDGVILFGSHAKGRANKNSDIDIAVLSRKFGRDRFKEGSLLNQIAYQLKMNIEVVPIGLKDWFDKNNISPILCEIKKNGIFII